MCAFMAFCAALACFTGEVADGPNPPAQATPTAASAGSEDPGHASLMTPSSVAPTPPSVGLTTSEARTSILETPVARCNEPERSWGFFADAIYFRPRWPDLELGIANRQNLGVPNGSVQRVDFDPALGFRLGVQRWKGDSGFLADNTYLSVDSNGAIASNPGATVAPTLTHPLGLRDVDSGLGTGQHKSNVFNLLWTRRIHADADFDFWVEGGGRAAWLQRGFGIDYFGGDAAPIARVDHDLDFWGYGLCGGLAGKWKLGCGWFIDAGGRLSLLASRNETSVVETSMRGAALLADASDCRTGFTPMFDLRASLSKAFGAWTLAVGYEMQQWFGVSELLTFNDDVHVGSLSRRRGDFGMDGLFLRLGVSF